MSSTMQNNEYRFVTCANRRPWNTPNGCACSSFIDEVTITYGRGKLDAYGCFEITCRECENYKDLVNDLDTLQAKENKGRGISCVKSVVDLMKRGELILARTVRQTEGDKTRSYPEVEALLYRIFGCRLHGYKNCTDTFCQELNKDLRI